MKYFKNTSWLFAEKILRMIVGLFVGVWVARYLGPEQYGLFSYAASFVGLFTIFATLGLDGIVVRELVKDESRRDVLLGTAFRLKQIGTVLVMGLLVIAIQFSSNDPYTNLLVFIIAGMMIFQTFNVIDFYFQSKVLSKYVTYVNIGSLLTSSLIKISLILADAPLVAFALAALFDSIIVASGLLYFYVKNGFSLKAWDFDRKVARDLLRDSWPLILSGLAVSVYMKIDQIMIKEMLNSEAVGQYAAAVRISEAWYFIPLLATKSLFPAIVNAKRIGRDLYYTRLQRLYDLMMWMTVAIALPMTLISKWLIDLLYGPQYSLAGSVLMIHIWTGVFVGLGLVKGKWLIAENLTRFPLYTAFISAGLNILLNYLLIPKYGIFGAAYGTLFSQIFSAYLINFFFKELRYQNVLVHRTFHFMRVFK